nr:SPLF3 glycoprotein [Cercopithecine betaherpesvirus 5]
MYNITGNKSAEHKLCESSGSHHTKHHWYNLCYNCSQGTLMLYNVTCNDSRKYVLKVEGESAPKPHVFNLTVTNGNGSSYKNTTIPPFCMYVSTTKSPSNQDQFIAVAVSSGANAAWALALVLTVVAAMILGRGK